MKRKDSPDLASLLEELRPEVPPELRDRVLPGCLLRNTPGAAVDYMSGVLDIVGAVVIGLIAGRFLPAAALDVWMEEHATFWREQGKPERAAPSLILREMLDNAQRGTAELH